MDEKPRKERASGSEGKRGKGVIVGKRSGRGELTLGGQKEWK